MKKYQIFILFLIGLSSALFAQTNPTDSLLQLAENSKDDSLKVTLYDRLAKINAAADNDKALKFADKALEISKKRDDASQTAGVQKTMGIIYFYRGDIDNAFNYFNKSKDTYEAAGNISGVARTYNNMGILYKNTGQITQAQESYLKAIEAFEKTNDAEGMALAYLNIGNLYNSQGDYKNALDNFLSALKFFETSQNHLKIAEVYNNIGILYGAQNEYDKALENFEKALKIYEKLNNTDRLADSYNNIGTIYLEQNKYSQALRQLEKSKDLCLEVGQPAKIATAYYNLGDVYTKLEDYDRALNYFRESLKIQEDLENTIGAAKCYSGIGEYYYYRKDYKKAIRNLEKAKRLAEGKDLITHKEATEWLSKAYEKTGNIKQAYLNHKLFKALNDSVFNENNRQNITQLSMQYEFDKQKSEADKRQKLAKIEFEAKQRRSKTIAYVMLGGIIVLILIAILLIRSSRIKSRANKLLAEQKAEIELKNIELEQQHEEILAISDQLAETNKEVTLQRDLAVKRQKEITDSIIYAQRIQEAVMPSEDLFKQAVRDYFILFKPRDIVSGDFYWMSVKGDKVIIAAADCTGHGVPGAFMSMLGISLLNEITGHGKDLDAGGILDELRAKVIESLHQTGKANEAKDGMDIALCIIDKKEQSVEYAGAYNPLYYIPKDSENNEIIQIKANRQPIGIFIKMGKPFAAQKFSYKTGDRLYLFSDGYADQFGGKLQQKMKAYRFRAVLSQTADLPMQKQKEYLEQFFLKWQGSERQVDDVILIGVEL